MPARSEPRELLAGSREVCRRWLTVRRALALVALLVVGARTARAQDVECSDQNEREVRSLRFTGNNSFSGDELSSRVIATQSSATRRILRIFGTKRCYPDVGLAPDVAILKQFYRNNGFYHTTVDTVVKSLGPNAVSITFRINEGPPVRLTAFAVLGLDSVKPDTQAIVHGLQEKIGGRFGQALLDADRDTIVTRLRNSGYPRAALPFPSQTIDPASLSATDTLNVETGPRARFGGIRIQSTSVSGGAPAIDTAVPRRLLGIKTGEVYSDQALSNAVRALYQTGAYRHVGVAIDTTFRSGDSVADVVADLREDYMHQYDQSEGWATLDCFRINADYLNRNAFGDAAQLQLTGRLSKIGYGAPTNSPTTKNLCYRRDLDQDPVASADLNYYGGATIRGNSLFGSSWVPAFSSYTERTGEFKTYLRTTFIGAQASATRNIGFQMPMRVALTGEYGNTQAQPAVLCAVFGRCTVDEEAVVERNLPLTVASVGLQKSTLDNPVEPRAGWTSSVELRGASQLLGAAPSLQFIKGTFSAAWFFPVDATKTALLRFAFGGITGGNDANGQPRVPPIQERLYAGGETSVRGFQQNSLGPVVYLVDENAFTVDTLPNGDKAYVLKPGASALRTIPLGGNEVLTMNAELRIRDPFFPTLLQYVLFDDAGEVWTHEASGQPAAFERLLTTPGVGVRVASPVGPIQLNAGYNPYGSIRGQALFASTSTSSSTAPLLCVTGPNDPQVPVHTAADGTQTQDLSACPATFKPGQSSNFFKRFTLTVSVSTAF